MFLISCRSDIACIWEWRFRHFLSTCWGWKYFNKWRHWFLNCFACGYFFIFYINWNGYYNRDF